MKTLIQQTAMVLIVGLVLAPVAGHACEKHAKAAAASTELPDLSLYNVESKWTDQNGKTVRLDTLAGHPRLIAMIFTKCPTACPLTVQGIKNVAASLSEEQRQNLKYELFSFDEDETRETMTGFIAKFKLDDAWSVRRSSSAGVAELAGALNVHYKRLPSGEFIHANVLFLVDERGVVVAKHEGLGAASEEFVREMIQVISGARKQE